jgi:C4-dicarboxylate transporter DctM subunit
MTFLGLLLILIVLLFTGIPVFAALGLFGAAVLLVAEGRMGSLGETLFGSLNTYALVSIPLFTLMAQFMIRGKVVDQLYNTTHTLVRHFPGGLGIATVGACTVFAAISGSSVATALTIGAAAIPQMIRYGYSPRYAFGVVGAGGTLGILIPPSGPMILYGVISDTSIGQLFIAGVIPGLMMAAIFAGWACFVAWRTRQGQREKRATLSEIGNALYRSFWALMLPPFILGGMYFGIFTATEAAGAGALAALLIAVFIYRNLSWREVGESARVSPRPAAMLFMFEAAPGGVGLALTKLRIPDEIVATVTHYDVSQTGFLLAMMVLIFILGMFLETISIILITTPVVLPVLHTLHINPVWYGVLLTINLELALITPPVGMNLFTIKAISKAPIGEIIRGIAPYVVLLIIGLAIVMALPDLALWLPRTAFKFAQ